MMKVKQGLKKLAALCLALVMVLGIGVPTVANAEEGSNVIDVVEVNGVQEAVVGEVASDAMTVPEGANYSVYASMCGWYDWTAEEGENSWLKDREGEQVFEDGHKYEMKVHIEPAEGYVFSENTILKINGEVVDDVTVSVDDDPYVAWSREYSFLQQVDKVEITNVPSAEVGGKATTEGITIPDDAKYEITQKAWYEVPVEGAHVQLDEGTVFEKGKKYRLQISVQPKRGFELSEGYEITVNGETPDEYWGSNPINVFQNYSFLDKLDKIEINNVPVAEVGGKATTQGVTIPEGAKYAVSDISWYNYTKDEFLNEGDVFEKGNIYNLDLTIKAADGYEFAEDTKAIVNGETLTYCDVNGHKAYIYEEYSFVEMINKIEINNAPIAEIGKEAIIAGITVPEGANYEIDYEYTEWYNETTEEDITVFEDGNRYSLCIAISAKEGYGFAEDAVVLVNGEEVYEEVYLHRDWGKIHCEYSFLEQIDKIEILKELPEAEVGATTEEIDDPQVPANANYTVKFAWMTNGNDEFTGKFEVGEAYILIVEIQAAEGYEFTEDVVVTVAGKTVDTPFITNDGRFYLLAKTYDFGDNTIDKIEITATEPKAGEKISVDNVKVPEGAKYEIIEAIWLDAKTEREAKGVFKEGKQYQLMVVVGTEPGVYLANDVKIMLNGKEFAGAKFNSDMIAMPFLAICELGFDLTVVDNNQNNDNTNSTQNNNQGTTSTPSPATGDNTNMILWIALAVIAMAGMAVVVSKKDTKYNKY